MPKFIEALNYKVPICLTSVEALQPIPGYNPWIEFTGLRNRDGDRE